MKRMEGRTALVTGAADGLGAAIAGRLAAEGARIGIIDRSEEAIDRARQQPALADAVFVAGDMTDAADIDRMVQAFSREGMAFDILVNNAGGSLHTPKAFLEETDEDWERVMALNVIAAVRISRHVLPGMVKNGFGRIINLGSKAGRYGSLFTGANYVAAKGAIQSMTLQMAQEFGPHGITCNAVCPGAILTPRVERLLSERMSPEERRKTVESIPVSRNGRVEDVAAAVAFFAADEAGFITGQLMDVNGGQGMAS